MLADWHVGQVLWSIVWFSLFVILIALLIGVFADIFHSHDLSGVAKALWVLFVIVLPYLGVFVYLIARGGGMHARGQQYLDREDRIARASIQESAGTPPSTG